MHTTVLFLRSSLATWIVFFSVVLNLKTAQCRPFFDMPKRKSGGGDAAAAKAKGQKVVPPGTDMPIVGEVVKWFLDECTLC